MILISAMLVLTLGAVLWCANMIDTEDNAASLIVMVFIITIWFMLLLGSKPL